MQCLNLLSNPVGYCRLLNYKKVKFAMTISRYDWYIIPKKDVKKFEKTLMHLKITGPDQLGGRTKERTATLAAGCSRNKQRQLERVAVQRLRYLEPVLCIFLEFFQSFILKKQIFLLTHSVLRVETKTELSTVLDVAECFVLKKEYPFTTAALVS